MQLVTWEAYETQPTTLTYVVGMYFSTVLAVLAVALRCPSCTSSSRWYDMRAFYYQHLHLSRRPAPPPPLGRRPGASGRHAAAH